jgi:nucleoside-diphosphate-sugar epimerase
MPLYLVTGGAGFIGSHLVEALVRQGRRVRVLDNFSYGKWDHLAGVRGRIDVQEGDVRNLDDCRQAASGTTVMIHLAAVHEVPRSVENPMEFHDINVSGTLNMLWAARQAGVRRVVFSSSSAVYGESPVNPRTESMTLDPTSSPYAVSKLAGEHYCRLFSRLYQLETVALRYFNVYGPRQDASSPYAAVIPKFLDALTTHTAPTIYGDGTQTRDFLHVHDCVAATLAACEASDVSGRVFNIGTGRRISINELCGTLQALLGTKFSPRYEPVRAGDIDHDLADIRQARHFLRYEPKMALHQGLHTMVQYV